MTLLSRVIGESRLCERTVVETALAVGSRWERTEVDELRSPLRPGLLLKCGYCMECFIHLALHLGEQVSHLVLVASEAFSDLQGCVV